MSRVIKWPPLPEEWPELHPGEPPSAHVHWHEERQCWWCYCCAEPVPFEHICSCETDDSWLGERADQPRALPSPGDAYAAGYNDGFARYNSREQEYR